MLLTCQLLIAPDVLLQPSGAEQKHQTPLRSLTQSDGTVGTPSSCPAARHPLPPVHSPSRSRKLSTGSTHTVWVNSKIRRMIRVVWERVQKNTSRNLCTGATSTAWVSSKMHRMFLAPLSMPQQNLDRRRRLSTDSECTVWVSGNLHRMIRVVWEQK